MTRSVRVSAARSLLERSISDEAAVVSQVAVSMSRQRQVDRGGKSELWRIAALEASAAHGEAARHGRITDSQSTTKRHHSGLTNVLIQENIAFRKEFLLFAVSQSAYFVPNTKLSLWINFSNNRICTAKSQTAVYVVSDQMTLFSFKCSIKWLER